MVNDEILGAYLDGELDATARGEVERAVAENAGVALRLKRLQQADSALRQALAAGPAHSDAALAQQILGAPTAAVSAIPPSWKYIARTFAPLAAAAVLGLLVGRLAAPASFDRDGNASMRVEAALARALDQAASGQVVTVMGGEAELALSLRTDDGILCRQFKLTSTHGASDALACREDGDWRLRAQVALDAADTSDFRAASVAAPSAIDVVVEGMGAVTVLDEAEEAAAIEAGWR